MTGFSSENLRKHHIIGQVHGLSRPSDRPKRPPTCRRPPQEGIRNLRQAYVKLTSFPPSFFSGGCPAEKVHTKQVLDEFAPPQIPTEN